MKINVTQIIMSKKLVNFDFHIVYVLINYCFGVFKLRDKYEK